MGAHAEMKGGSFMATRRWLVLAVLSLGLLMVVLDNSVLYTALPALTEDLDASSSEGLWIINAYPLVMAGLLLGAGTLGDKVGHRRMFIIGLVIFGLASLAAAYAVSPVMLIAGRALLAIGAALVMPATLALIRQMFEDVRSRNLAISIWGSVALVGAALGPVVAGVLLEHFWWGSVFLINIPFVFVALVGAIALAPRTSPNPLVRWDAVSSLLALIGLSATVFFIKEVAKLEPSWMVVAVSAVVAAAGISSFLRRQSRLDQPLLDLEVFRSKPLSAGVIGAGVAMFAIAGFQLITTQRFQLAEGYSPLEAGLLVTCLAVGSIPSSLLAGLLMHRTGVTFMLVGGLGVGCLGLMGAWLLLPHSTAAFAVALGVAGFGLGAAMAAASAAVMGNVPSERAGMASSVEEVSYEFGSLTAVAVLGSVFASLASSAGAAEGFSVAAGVAVGTLAISVAVVGVMLRGVRVQQGH